jgi:gas vesicle protein
MAREDTTEFLTAFAVGTVLGIGATLLLRPEPKSAKERLMRELKPYRRRMDRSTARVVRGVREGGRATRALSDDAIDAGRELLAEFRDEVRRIVADARDELKDAVEERFPERRASHRRTGERREAERRGAGRRFGLKPREE